MWFNTLPYDWECPKIDYKEGVLKIYGKSIPSDAYITYLPVIDELEKYAENNNDLILVFELDYINTSSLRSLMKIIQILNDMHEKKGNVSVIWKYLEIDERVQEQGEDLRDFAVKDFKTRIFPRNNDLRKFEFKIKEI